MPSKKKSQSTANNNILKDDKSKKQTGFGG